MVGDTHVVSVPPMDIRAVETQKSTKNTPYDNFVNSIYFMYQANGLCHPQGIMVSEGRVICDNQPHDKPGGTLIVYRNGEVDCKPLLSILAEKNVWFAVSGCSILPEIRMAQEGFTGKYSDIGRSAARPVIGYNPAENMIKIAVRDNTPIERGQLTLKNLGCTCGITLDAGGSTTLKVSGEYKFKGDGRQLFGGVVW